MEFWWADKIVTLVTLGLVAVLAVYVNRKMHNLAELEDISKITGKVESVKSEYLTKLEEVRAVHAKGLEELKSTNSHGLEMLRTELGYASQLKSSLWDKEREAVIQFFDSVATLLHTKTNVDFGDVPSTKDNFANDYAEEIRASFASVHMNFYRLALFLPSGHPLLIAAEDVLKEVSNIEIAFRENFSLVSNALGRYRVMAGVPHDKNELEEFVVEAFEAIRTYHSLMNPIVTGAMEVQSRFICTAREYFTSKSHHAPAQATGSATITSAAAPRTA